MSISKKYNGRVPACGCFCGGCPVYVRDKKACPGASLTDRCNNCKSYHLCCQEKDITHCFQCKTYPCAKFKSFRKRWLKYGQDFFDNQQFLKEHGIEAFLQYWNEKSNNNTVTVTKPPKEKKRTSKYYIDLTAFSLSRFKERIEHDYLIPSQRLLKEKIDLHFAILESNGINNLGDLHLALKTKKTISAFANKTGLPEEYLTKVYREINGYLPKPVKLDAFPGIDPDVIRKLNEIGVKNTLHLFDRVLSEEDREELSAQLAISDQDILDLTKLTDVARLRWVGPGFARLLVESSYDTVEEISKANYKELFHDLKNTNEKKKLYKGKLSQNDDLKMFIKIANDLPREIQY